MFFYASTHLNWRYGKVYRFVEDNIFQFVVKFLL